MSAILGSVGRAGLNADQDVMAVETFLARHRSWLSPMPMLLPDATCTAETIDAIRKFQSTAAALHEDDCDGVVSPRGFTIKRLELGHIPMPRHRVFTPMSWARGVGLLPADYERAAKTLKCEAAAIEAVATQEAGKRGAWDEFGRPTILFERHKFGEYSKHIWDKTHSDISSKRQSTNKARQRDRYGAYSLQYKKLYRAATLDETAALQSASWGLFQMLGDKYDKSGFASVDAFVDAMLESASVHLNIFVAYIAGNPGLLKAIRDKNWARFARLYNGASYKDNQYDTKMAAHYKRLTEEAALKAKTLNQGQR
jgi:hypothetical protein